MQVQELVDVARFFKEFIQERQLLQQYQQLINAVTQAAQNQNPQNVEVQLEGLLNLHQEAEERVLSPAQEKLITEYGAGDLLGAKARSRLEHIFTEHRAHPQGQINALQVLLNETNQFVKRANELVDTLGPMLVKLEPDGLQRDEGRLWLYFANAASVNTIDDLERAAKTWKQVLHDFSRLPDASADSGRILQIHKFSPLEIELAAKVVVLVPLALGIQWVLARVEHVIKILQEAENLKQLKVKTKIIKDLEKEADEQRNKITSEAADEIQKKFEASSEARNAAEQALKRVLKFIEGGGELDINVAASEEPDGTDGSPAESEERVQLRAMIKDIRRDMKLLPAGAMEFVAEEPTSIKEEEP